jgi:arginyl-tRNA synthetase
MIELKKKIAALIEGAVKEKFGEGLLSAADIFGMLEYPPDKTMGDIALPCFRLSKVLRRSPVQIAEALSEALSDPEFSEVTVAGGYLNIKIDLQNFSKRVVADVERLGASYGSPMCGDGKTVVLDY